MTQSGAAIVTGALELRPEEGLAVVAGTPVQLTVREFGLLRVLAEHVGHVVRREALFAAVWGAELKPGDRSIDVYVHKLRAKLQPLLPEAIHTHVGFGYRLDPEVHADVHTTFTASPQGATMMRLAGADDGPGDRSKEPHLS